MTATTGSSNPVDRAKRPAPELDTLNHAGAAGSDVAGSDGGAEKTDPVSAASGITLAGAVGLLYVLLGFLIGSRVISDNSFLTHFANGRLIWNGPGIPRVDPYSFSAAGEPVTVQSWLASWVYVGLHQTFGDWSLRIFNGLLGALLVTSLWRLSSGARQLLPRVAVVGAAIVVGAGLWTPRPLLFGLLCFVALLHVARHDLPAWALVPIMWIWVNSHGSFPIAFVLIGAMGVGQALDDLMAARTGSRRWTLPWHEIKVFGWLTVGTAAGAVNPLGAKLLWFPISLLSRSEALEHVAEWQSPTFQKPHEWGFVALGLGLLVAIKQGARWRAIVPAVAFIGAGLMAYRNLPMASIVLVVSISPFLDTRRFSIDGDARGVVPSALRFVAVVGIAALAVVTATSGAVDLRRFPVEEVDWLEARNLVANPDIHLIQRDTVGNYLEFRFGSEAQVFMDDRFDFYPLPVLRDHDTLIFGGDYAQVLQRHDAQVVLWKNEGEFVQWLEDSPNWFVAYESELTPEHLVAQDDGWIVACRVGSEAAARCR